MKPKISSAAAGLISIVSNKVASLASFLCFILWCIFHSFLISIQDFFSFFLHCVSLAALRRGFVLGAIAPPGYRADCHMLVPSLVPVLQPEACQARACGNSVTREDAQFVMEKMGLSLGPGSEEGSSGSTLEVGDQVFYELGSLLEDANLRDMREAFGVFDENKDGFIDKRELGRVLECIGLTGISDDELGRMILVFDENGDGRIDFGEFVKLMKDCSC